MDMIGMLQDGSGAIAWLTAILLALGGTAVVMAIWTQVRRGVPVSAVLKAAIGIRQARTAPKPAAHATETAPQAVQARSAPQQRTEPVHQAVRAYRSESDLEQPGDVLDVPAALRDEAPEVLSERQLTVYLNRLRRAADALEEVARRDAAPNGGSEEASLLATH